MTSAELLELLTKGPEYELHEKDCKRSYCTCPGPDLLKEIKEVLRHAN